MNRDWLLQRATRITATLLVTIVLLASATGVNAAEEKPDDRWRFTITPYLWLPSMSASMKLETDSGSGSVDVNAKATDILENLRFAGMLSFQGQKGRWSFLADLIYVNLSTDDEKAKVSGVVVQADAEMQSFVSNLAGAYSVFRNEFLNFDLLAGVRYSVIDAKVSLDNTRPLPVGVRSRDFSETEHFVDPIIGFKGKFDLGKKWYLPYYFDIGGFGVDSDLTLQAFAGIGYRFSDSFSTMLGYRYLYYDFGNTKLVKDLSMYGPALGFSFAF